MYICPWLSKQNQVQACELTCMTVYTRQPDDAVMTAKPSSLLPILPCGTPVDAALHIRRLSQLEAVQSAQALAERTTRP